MIGDGNRNSRATRHSAVRRSCVTWPYNGLPVLLVRRRHKPGHKDGMATAKWIWKPFDGIRWHHRKLIHVLYSHLVS